MTSDDENFEPSRAGRQLYALLPAIYRTRDGSEHHEGRDLERLLDGFGELFDDLRGLVEQLLADSFADGQSSLAQSWLLPYFGALVDARMVSPDVAGQRAEVGSAVRWRQRKGTLLAASEITQEIGAVVAVLHEGWQRVAVSPRLGDARQLPVTVDFRRSLHAVRSTIDGDGARFTHFDGVERAWENVEHGGVPRHRDSYQDVSLRTPELRRAEPRHKRGFIHPKRLLAWIAPEQSLFPAPTLRMSWAEFVAGGDGARAELGAPDRIFVSRYAGELEISDPVVTLGEALHHHLERLSFVGELRIPAGRASLREVRTPLLVLGGQGTSPILDARDCLLGQLRATGRSVVLDACTVLGSSACGTLEASDSLFVGLLAGDEDGLNPVAAAKLVRCALGEARLGPEATLTATLTATDAEFLSTDFDSGLCGVLHPRTSSAISMGGRDGRELGRFHRGRTYQSLVVGMLDLGDLPELDLDAPHPALCDLVVTGALRWRSGTLAIERVVAGQLLGPVDPAGDELPRRTLSARSCILQTVTVANSELRLEYCTVFHLQHIHRLLCSDCIIVAGPTPTSEATLWLRWSRLPPNWNATAYFGCHDEPPRFIEDHFGSPFHALLVPDGSTRLSQGAEDGGELGAYHDAYWCLRLDGVLRKLREHLPLGIEPVLIPDPHLIIHPPLDSEVP